jgi:hypothetical protein
MYKSENTHRFPALVLAASFTTAVIIGLSALAQSQAGMKAYSRQLVAAPSVSQTVATEAIVAPLRIDVIGYRSEAGAEFQAAAAGGRQPG